MKKRILLMSAVLATALLLGSCRGHKDCQGRRHTVKTDMGGEGAPMEIVDGAKTSVALATLHSSGPTGGYFHLGQTLPW